MHPNNLANHQNVPSGASAGTQTHVEYLDGWRGLAICMLLVGHFFPVPGINFGTVGVNLFFVLSGLLMSGLLFDKCEPISRFYRRRIARILPAHLLFVATMALVFWLKDQLSARETLSALFFVNNYVQPAAGPGTALMPLGHIWSLSVEEHSYVALSMVAIAARARRLRAVAGIGALLGATIFCALVYQWLNPPALVFTQWLHTEVAAYGLLATALWVAAGRPWPRRLAAGWVAPVLLVLGVALHWWSAPLAVQRLLGVGCFAAAICALYSTPGLLGALLSWTPLRKFGHWSFSIYLWQQPFYLGAHDDSAHARMLALLIRKYLT